MTMVSVPERAKEGASKSFVPKIHLSTAHFTVNRGDAFKPRYEDVELPVIALTFTYPGGEIEAGDPELTCEPENDTRPSALVVRDRAAERAARMALEGFGAVELACLEEYGLDPHANADYLVNLEEDPSAYCAFTALAVPELERRGFAVQIAQGYPYRLVDPDSVAWYSELGDEEGRPGWFNLELGVEIEGQRVSLVPVLLELLERSGELSSLRALERGTERLLVVEAEGHGYVRVQPDRLRRLWNVLIELYHRDNFDGKRLCFDASQANALGGLRDALGEGESLSLSGAEDLQHLLDGFLATPDPVTPESLRVQATLRPYQLEGVAWLQHLVKHRVGGILADDMGLGKTLQTITHLSLEHTGNALVPPSLIVCPTSLVGNWARELARFAPQLRVRLYHGPNRHEQREWLDAADVIVTSYPILLRDAEILEPIHYHIVVLDEAQAIKNASGSAHEAVCALKSEHRLCLTGTPIENHLGELWSQFQFLSPGWLGTEAQFRARYPSSVSSSLADRARLDALHQKVAPHILRRVKDEVAPDLPPKLLTMVPIELSGKQRELYESIRSAAHHDVRRAIRVKGLEGSTIAVLDALMKLRQVCCDPRLVGMEAARFVRESVKFTRLFQLLETHLECKRRVLVFSQFTGMLDLIGKELIARDIDYLSLTGQTQNRQAKVDAFERGHADVFLISLKAGGTGLNLTSADTVIHYDPWWNPAAQDQATDRAYRIGQKKPVLVQELVIVGSVEERMRALQQQKRELARAILHGEIPGEKRLSERDVDDLLAPLEV
jgi:superfamily II DNA or RNA helicase